MRDQGRSNVTPQQMPLTQSYVYEANQSADHQGHLEKYALIKVAFLGLNFVEPPRVNTFSKSLLS